ncbi:MAG: endonuclease/exonuclease/phosphatase family protein [Ardenticatenaceae bacterium]|nr:endonuclease/exonuclease/phosphatase family protein [Ardenticatenaceae bacterium]
MSTAFTVMTWNIENLFPPGHRVSPRKVVSQEAYDGKLDYLARVIRRLNPDVIALQEIGGRTKADTVPLEALQTRLAPDYPFSALSNKPDGRFIKVGFLSKIPIENAEDISDFPDGELADVPNWSDKPDIIRMGRGALKIEVVPAANNRVRLVTAHLKSKLISYPKKGDFARFQPDDENERTRGVGLALVRRTAEAVTIRRWLNEVMGEHDTMHTVLLGDFNDVPRAATSQILLGVEDADATSDDKFDDVRLFNLTDSIPQRGDELHDKRFVPEDHRFSRKYMGRYEMLDQIMVSKKLLGEAAAMRQDHWVVQEVCSLVESITGQSIDDNPVNRIGEERPDHAPVYARFELPD